MNRFTFFTALAAIAVVMTSCGSGDEPPAPTPPAGGTVAVTGVTLDKTTLSLVEGATETLTATVKPEGATNKAVTWKSSDESVATVDGTGKVTAHKAGTATITTTTTDAGKTASCAVTVSAPVVSYEYWDTAWRRNSIAGKVQTVIERNRADGPGRYTKLSFDRHGNMLEKATYLNDKIDGGFTFTYDERNRLISLDYYVDGEVDETSSFTYGGEFTHDVYIPCSLLPDDLFSALTVFDLRLNRGVTRIQYQYGGESLDLKCISVDDDGLVFETPDYMGTPALIHITADGCWPVNLTMEYLVDDGEKGRLADIEFSDSGVPTRLVVLEYVSSGLPLWEVDYTEINGFQCATQSVYIANSDGSRRSNYTYTYTEQGHVATEMVNGKLERRFTYTYDERGNWTRRELTAGGVDVTTREYTYFE